MHLTISKASNIGSPEHLVSFLVFELFLTQSCHHQIFSFIARYNSSPWKYDLTKCSPPIMKASMGLVSYSKHKFLRKGPSVDVYFLVRRTVLDIKSLILATEMGACVKCLLFKPEDFILNPQHPYGSQVWMYTYSPSAGEISMPGRNENILKNRFVFHSGFLTVETRHLRNL